MKADFLTRLFSFVIGLATCFILSGCPTKPEEQPPPSYRSIAETAFGRLPSWSPDGSKIVFGDDRPGNSGIYIWDTNGDPVAIAPNLPAHNWDYVWSHDGSLITFSSPGATGSAQTGIWCVNVGNKTAVRLFDRGSDPRWFATDSAIAVRIDDPHGDNPGIFSVSYPSGKLIKVLDGGYKPLPSPVGSRILFTDTEINGTLYSMIINGSTDLVAGVGIRWFAWSQTAETVFSLADRLSDRGTYSGSLLRTRIADFKSDTILVNCAQPSVTPDGAAIAYMSNLSGLWNGLWINSSDGSVKVSDDAVHPSISPDGSLIAAEKTGGGIVIFSK